MQTQTRFRITAAVAAGVLFLEGSWYLTELGGPVATTAFADLLPIAICGWATVVSWKRAREESGRLARGWWLLGGAVLSWGVGEAIWTVYEVFLGREVPFPSFADFGFLLMIPLAALALLSFPAAPDMIVSRVRTLLDGMIISGSLLFIWWQTVLRPVARAGADSGLELGLSLAYPVGDAMLLAVVLFVAGRARRDGRLPVGLVAGGLAALAIADTGFTFLALKGTYESGGSLIDLGWTGGFLLIGLGAVRPVRRRHRSAAARRRVAWVPVVLLYGALVAAIGAACIEQIAVGRLGPFLFWNSISVVALVVVRHLVTLFENLRLTRGLEDAVDARTAELRKALHQVEEAHSLQDAFIANASHELRTPVTAMSVVSRTLLRREFGIEGQARELLHIADRNATRMARLVEDLLICSGLTDTVAEGLAPSDVRGIVEASAAAAAGDRRVVIRAPERALALADPDRVRTILSQVVDNALKFSPADGEVTIEIVSLPRWLQVLVSDEGPGIAQGLRERVFDRFYQIDGSATRSHGGVGLGLYVARRLAQSMGGSLTAEQSAAGGAAFRLSLRPAPVPAPDGASRSPDAFPAAAPSH